MANTKKNVGMKITKGSIPMVSGDGRKYKVREASAHDFTSEPRLKGRIVALGSIIVDDDERDVMVIESESGLSQIFQSKALEEAFKLGGVGDHVDIVYKGEKDLGGGRTFKRYSVAVWSE